MKEQVKVALILVFATMTATLLTVRAINTLNKRTFWQEAAYTTVYQGCLSGALRNYLEDPVVDLTLARAYCKKHAQCVTRDMKNEEAFFNTTPDTMDIKQRICINKYRKLGLRAFKK